MAALLSLFLAVHAPTVRADEIAEFYKGRSVSIVIGHETGTGFDLYGRLMARHLGRHIPGQPSMVAQNMPGGGGLNAAQWLYNVASKDGATLGIFAHTAPFEPLLGEGKAKLDGSKFNWIGNLDETSAICAIMASTGIETGEDFLRKGVLVGSSGGPLGVFPTTLRKLLGSNLKLVHGYKGSADVKLAMQRGEVQAICGISISTLKSQWADELAKGLVRITLQFGRKPHPDMPGVEHVLARARTPDERQVYELVYGATTLGRALAAPPGLQAARVKALRTAFMAMIASADFLADAAKSRLDLSPNSGEDIEAFVNRLYASPRDVVERARAVTKID